MCVTSAALCNVCNCVTSAMVSLQTLETQLASARAQHNSMVEAVEKATPYTSDEGFESLHSSVARCKEQLDKVSGSLQV